LDEQSKQVDDDRLEEPTKMASKENTIRFYFTLTYQLAKEDITKIQQMDDIPMYLCLNIAAMMKERHDKEQEEIRKIERQMKK
jgi:lipoprotein NlpI